MFTRDAESSYNYIRNLIKIQIYGEKRKVLFLNT